MRLLLKLTFGILVLSASILVFLVAQRNWRATDLDHTLQLTSADCGEDCWFAIPVGGTMPWRDVQANIEASGGTDMRFRGGTMRLRIPNEDKPNFNIGHVQVLFDDVGNPIQTCFFVNEYTIGDVLTTFGLPERFWFDVTSQRFSFGTSFNQPDFYYITYQMIYPDEIIVVEGTLQVDAETNLPLKSEKQSIPLNAPVNQMCTPGNLDYVSVEHLPHWAGLYKSIEFYEAYPPPTKVDGEPIDDPSLLNEPLR